MNIAFMASIEVPVLSSTIADLLATGVDTPLFEGMISEPLERVGAPSLFYSLSMA